MSDNSMNILKAADLLYFAIHLELVRWFEGIEQNPEEHSAHFVWEWVHQLQRGYMGGNAKDYDDI